MTTSRMRSDNSRGMLTVHHDDFPQEQEFGLTARNKDTSTGQNSGTEKPAACNACGHVDWESPPRTCQGCEATVCLKHSGQVEAARVVQASEGYLDDSRYLAKVDGKAHAHLLLNSATLRGQQAAVYSKSCPSGNLAIESTEMSKVSSAGDGNCAFYSVCNGLSTIANEPTADAYPTHVVRALKSTVANAVIKHVTAGQARGLEQLMEQCSGPYGGRLLRLLQGARARMVGLDVLDSFDNRQPLSLFKDELLHEVVRDNQYLPLGMMGALAQAIDTNIVVWVQHPTSPDKLIVHREEQGNYLSVHAPVGATHTIHLHFHNSSNPGDADVYRWAAGSSGHFQLLVPRPAQEGGGGGGVDDSTAAAAVVRTYWYSRLARMLAYCSDIAKLTILIYGKIVSPRNGPGSGKRGCAIKIKDSPGPADDGGLPAGGGGGGGLLSAAADKQSSEDKKKEEPASPKGQDSGGLLTLCTCCLETLKTPNEQTIDNERNKPPTATAPPAAANLSAAVSDVASVSGVHPARGGSIITATPPSSPSTCSSLGGPVSSPKSTSVPTGGCEGEGEEPPRTFKSGFFTRSLPKMAGAIAVIGVAATVGAMVLGRRR